MPRKPLHSRPSDRVGVLGSTEIPEPTQTFLEGFREGGYVVGQDLQTEFRYFQGRYDKMPALLTELAYVVKILNGEKPGDLLVQQPTRYDVIVNLQTAKTLGITVPPAILSQADEVIE